MVLHPQVNGGKRKYMSYW